MQSLRVNRDLLEGRHRLCEVFSGLEVRGFAARYFEDQNLVFGKYCVQNPVATDSKSVGILCSLEFSATCGIS